MKSKTKKLLMLLVFSVLTVTLVACGTATDDESARTEEPGNSGSTQESDVEDDSATTESGEKITIKVADSFPTTHLIPKYGTIPWIERIEELGEGKIEVEYYPAEQLGKANSLLDVAKNKVADITYVGPLYVSDKVPLSGVSGNPGLVQDALSGSRAFNKLIHEDLYEVEFKPHGVMPLWGCTTNPYQIVTSPRPVKTIEDFKGLKIRTSGGLQEAMMQEWGATPVSIPGPEIYTAWERGTIDGSLLSFFSWPGYQVDKVAKYSSTNAALSAFGVTYVVNEEVWNSWPEDVRNIVTQASEEIVDVVGQAIIDDEIELQKQYKEAGIELYELPEDELQRWNEELAPFNDKWAKDLDAKGLPGTEILEKFKQYLDEFSQ